MDEPVWRRYLRLVRPDATADVDEELRFHVDMRARELEAEGFSPDEARRAALARFGDMEAVRSWLRSHDQQREHADQHRERMTVFLHHLRYAVRSLRKQPAFTAAAVLTLALGTGATAAIFGVVDGVLLEPLPYERPEQLVSLGHTTDIVSGVPIGQSVATYSIYRQLNRTLSDVGAYMEEAVNVTAGASTRRVPAGRATASVFTVLEVEPLVGRTFIAADERPGGPPVVLLSEGFWRGDLGGAGDVIGSMVRIDGVQHEVIGVLPASVRIPRDETRLWLPLLIDRTSEQVGSFNYAGIGRLRPDATHETAAADLQRALVRVPEFFPFVAPGLPMRQFLETAKPRVVVRSMRDEVVGDVGRVLWVIFGTIAFVLIAACANIANLCLVRAEGRQSELAVRAALGASRGNLHARFLAESAVLATAGAALGVGIAAIGLRVLRDVTTLPIPRLAEVEVDGSVLALSLVLAVMVALMTSLLPILRLGTRDLAPHLRAGGRGATPGGDRRTVQRGLVVLQVALAFVVLAASVLMARTFVELRQVPLGFDASRALTFRIALPQATYPGAADVGRFQDRLEERLAGLPGVEAVAVTSRLPLERDPASMNPVWVEGDESAQREMPPARPLVMSSPSYFRSLGIPMLRGRPFQDAVPGQAPDEVVVSSAFARQVWGERGEQGAIGRRVRLLPTEPWLSVVGVAGSVRDAGLGRDPSPVVYLPIGFYDVGDTVVPRVARVVVRTQGAPITLSAAARREVEALDPSLAVFDLQPMDALVRRSMARTSFTALLLAIAAGVALALGAIGLYGVVAYSAGMRRKEIGLRIALGSPPSAVSRLLVRQGAVLAAVGAALGLVAAVAVTRVLKALLYGVSPTDPLVLAGAAAVLLVVVLGASWIPAWRASRLDPSSVLSGE